MRSLRTKLLLVIAAIVVLSGLVISQIIIHHYRISLHRNAAAQAQSIALNLSFDAADKILLNDLVALQKLLDDRVRSDKGIAYLFVLREGKILTHTFASDVPVQLIAANGVPNNHEGYIRKIVSEKGNRYLDVAWPIAEQKAGILRLGYSETLFRKQVSRLWLQISMLTLGILSFSMILGLLLIRQITRPLLRLTAAVDQIDENHLGVAIPVEGRDEAGRLGIAFRSMLTRLRDYTHRLEENARELEAKNRELDRAHRQTRTLFEITKTVSALADLKSICEFITDQLQKIVTCRKITILLCSENPKLMLVYSASTLKAVDEADIEGIRRLLEKTGGMKFYGKTEIPLSLTEFEVAHKVAVFPFHHEKGLIGAVCVGCSGECTCVANDLDVIGILLEQTAGAIRRGVVQESEVRNLRHRIEQSAGFGELIGKDPQMQIIYKLIEDVAFSDATVLIQGESGTGKELVARAIHDKSPRRDKPFVVINCSAYPATLLESELFGHEKGAFTGAVRQKAGRFEQAEGGTVFLDEIGDISAAAQVKLLRVLQNKMVERVGGETTITVDIRILAATNKNLLEEVKNRRFREDLFYRLNVIPIHLPPLHRRHNDIPLLARHFLKQYSSLQSKPLKDFNPEAMRKLLGYSWPGNVRELENSVEHAVVLARGDTVQPTDLPSVIQMNTGKASSRAVLEEHTLEKTEKNHLIEILTACDWNKKEAARRLGIGRSTLYSKMKKYQISQPAAD